MAVRLIVPMEAAPGKRDELIQALRTLSRDVLQESGCEQFELYQSTERPDQLALLELWIDETTQKAHSELNRKRGNTSASLTKGTAQYERYITQP